MKYATFMVIVLFLVFGCENNPVQTVEDPPKPELALVDGSERISFRKTGAGAYYAYGKVMAVNTSETEAIDKEPGCYAIWSFIDSVTKEISQYDLYECFPRFVRAGEHTIAETYDRELEYYGLMHSYRPSHLVLGLFPVGRMYVWEYPDVEVPGKITRISPIETIPVWMKPALEKLRRIGQEQVP